MRRSAARAAVNDIAGAADDLSRARALIPGGNRGQRKWAAARLGEGIRQSIRDAALAPDAGMPEVEVLLNAMDAAMAAFTEALQLDPDCAWAHAHRGAVAVLAHWLGARFGLEPGRVRHYAESARDDLDMAVRLNGTYAWAMVFQAILLTVMGANTPVEAARHELFAQATGRVQEAERADKGLVMRLAPVELALYARDYHRVVEQGWAQLASNPDNTITRYCVAVALKQLSAGHETADASVEQVRRTTAATVMEQVRKEMLAKRSRNCAMLGGLAMLEGRFEVAAAMLGDVLEYPDMDTLVFISCDPAWEPARQPATSAVDDVRLGTVREAYKKLFPRVLAPEA
jgi:hypothetical protein